MLSTAKARYLRALQQNKYRQKYHKITVEGLKVCDEILSEGLLDVTEIFALEGWFERNDRLISAQTDRHIVTDAELKKVSNHQSPQEVLIVGEMPKVKVFIEAPSHEWCLYLEAIRDPGNLGTICRIADWYGIRHVFLSPDCVDHYNPKVIQSSMASVFRVLPVQIDLRELVNKNSGVNVWATTLHGESIYQIGETYSSGICLIGNESRGLSADALKLADRQISIPRDLSLGADSLNAAVATAVILSHLRFGMP